MKKKQTIYLILGAVGLFFLFRKGGGIPPPPPPPLECPLYYTSDGSKCVPVTPTQTQSWSYIVGTSDVDTNSFRLNASPRIPSGFSGCIVVHVQVTNAATHEQVAYEIVQREFSAYSGGYINASFFIALPAPQTLYNVFTYVSNCTVTDRYSGLVFKQVRTK